MADRVMVSGNNRLWEHPVSRSCQAKEGRVLVLFGMLSLGEMLEKGNISQLKNYLASYSRVEYAYLAGRTTSYAIDENVHAHSIGYDSLRKSILLSPILLYRFVRKIQQEESRRLTLITADQWFSWWSTILIRSRGLNFAIMPVCLPEELGRDQSGSASGLPGPLDKAFRWLSARACKAVITGQTLQTYVSWLESKVWTRRKLVVLNAIPEEFPSPTFLEALDEGRKLTPKKEIPRDECGSLKLIYVGRLHKEKLVADLLEALALADDKQLFLTLVGDGPELNALVLKAKQLEIQDRVCFLGSVPNEELPSILSEADVFLSPLTGTSLREAACCGLPIIAYQRDWVLDVLVDGENSLLVPDRDTEALASAIMRMRNDSQLRLALGEASTELANRYWRNATGVDLFAPLEKVLLAGRHRNVLSNRK